MATHLTERQRKFIDAYLGPAKGKGSKAARMAGYTGNPNTIGGTAHGLLKNPKIQAAMEERRNQVSEGMGVDELVALWSRIARDEGETTQNRLRAAEYLGKMRGVFIEKSINANVNVGNVQSLTDDQLLQIAGQTAPSIVGGTVGDDQGSVLTLPAASESEQPGLPEIVDADNE